EDTTEMDWTGRDPIPGLGPVGSSNERTQGVHLHTVLAVGWPPTWSAHPDGRRPGVRLLGVAEQEYYLRVPVPQGESKASIACKLRDRESQLWERASRRLGAPEAGVRFVRVCD